MAETEQSSGNSHQTDINLIADNLETNIPIISRLLYKLLFCSWSGERDVRVWKKKLSCVSRRASCYESM